MIFFFILITCLLDFVLILGLRSYDLRRNSVLVSNRSLGVNQTVLNQLELALPWVVLFFCKCTGVFTLFVLFQLWSHTWSEDWRIFTICIHWVWECKCLLPLDDSSMVIKNVMSYSALAYLRLLFRNFDPYVCQDMINNSSILLYNISLHFENFW